MTDPDSIVLDRAIDPREDPAAYRRALGGFPTGIAVMTAATRLGAVGVTANSFGSVSLDPPLVQWSLRTTSISLPTFRDAGHFAVNVLAWHQEDMSQRFARPAAGKFDGVPCTAGLGDAPLLEGCAAHYECRLVQEFESGDHVVLVGEVHRFRNFHREPLIFYRGDHRWFDQPVIS